MTRDRPRSPSPAELRLWQTVTESVAPLGGKAPAPRVAGKPQPQPQPDAVATIPAPAQPRAGPPALNPIDRRTVTRLGRGSVTIDARIDLHGMTQATAHGRLLRFLREAQEHGARIVLVVTGKGRSGADDEPVGRGRGVLRRLAPLWLASPELRPFVVGFGESSPAHGGSGALYVRIRRPRGPSR
jgi:DNA-nicking Smr family endonuclease